MATQPPLVRGGVASGRPAPVAPIIYGGLKRWASGVSRRLKISDHFHFEDRRCGAASVVCLLAGDKPELWPFAMPRLKSALSDSDVCLVTPGQRRTDLADLCRREGWSYLSTATNESSLAQNVCYRLHDDAELIIKLDEDMFLLPGSISALITQYKLIKGEGIVDPGFVAPMIPINGYCYRPLLEMLGLLEEYEALFGRARIAFSGLPVHDDPAAASWIWERTAPLEATAMRLAAMPARTLFCPVQFNSGLIVFERSFWEQIGRLPVLRRRLVFGVSTQGADEEYFCSKAVEASRPGVITSTVLAGHFSFDPQYPGMTSLLKQRPELFAPRRSFD